MKRKQLIKWMAVAAESLPEETYKAYHKYKKSRMEKDEQGKDILRNGYLADHPVNHKRRLLEIYDKLGIQGVETYLNQRGFTLQPPQEQPAE